MLAIVDNSPFPYTAAAACHGRYHPVVVVDRLIALSLIALSITLPLWSEIDLLAAVDKMHSFSISVLLGAAAVVCNDALVSSSFTEVALQAGARQDSLRQQHASLQRLQCRFPFSLQVAEKLPRHGARQRTFTLQVVQSQS
jgi:hypothetical protein